MLRDMSRGRNVKATKFGFKLGPKAISYLAFQLF